jgi:hypothetical protein
VQGINLVSTIWTDGTAIAPVDFRIYHPDDDGRTKNDHFREMLMMAKVRQFYPECILFDSWYGSIENLKLICSPGWHWFTCLKSNRLVNPDDTHNRPVSDLEIPSGGKVVHLRAHGFIRVFIVEDTGGTTGVLGHRYSRGRNQRGNHTRGLAGRSRSSTGGSAVLRGGGVPGEERDRPRSHILLSTLAFLRLESHQLKNGISWHESERMIHRPAVSLFIARPTIIP